ncbi:MAG TPA: peroxiredoxin [Burkholderiales bacterium]|nr:peroxiredoxin [Burkholderiales bacterium]
MRPDNLYQLPKDLPVPQDDGACSHLSGMRLPCVELPSTMGAPVDLSALEGHAVVYFYPRTGRPDEDTLPGWDAIPGARGCTPQSCAFRDHYSELVGLGVRNVFGVSTQDTAYQAEAAERLHLPFALLSDEKLELARALALPTFDIAGLTLIKRLTMVVNAGIIEHVFYPVFPPDSNAPNVIHWLVERSTVGR